MPNDVGGESFFIAFIVQPVFNSGMLSRVHSVTLHGIEAIACEVEVDVSTRGQEGASLVGLPDAAVKESLDRIRAALQNDGFRFPAGRVLVNLAPADVRKEGPAFDLPIAMGILLADGQIESATVRGYLLAGELALDGRVRAIRGTLSMAMLAKQLGFRGVIVPRDNAAEAAVVDGIEAIGVGSLTEAVGFLIGHLPLEPMAIQTDELFQRLATHELDFVDVRGQEHAKRAMILAAAGRHNVLMIGPPGTGKTMLCQRLPSILPPMTLAEALETTRIYSSVGLVKPNLGLVTDRPVRTPHHSASSPALVGGGSVPQPGEVSLAHNGVLFLDELPEFQRATLEMIRQPMEDAVVTIARAMHALTFPADFMLIAAMNPCPCGYHGHPRKRCRCTPVQIDKYSGKISGPLLDRIDIHLDVPPVDLDRLRAAPPGETSASMRHKVLAARAIQDRRFADQPGMTNGRMTPKLLRQHCTLDDAGEALLRAAINELGLSARAHDKVLRLARTIADLDGGGPITAVHLGEAIQYRRLDRSR
jgi:magnesium chelatase family protein